MPRPEDVNPHNFHVRHVIYNDSDFSIAWGQWADGNMCIGMRWNGDGGDAGYPKTFGNPVWFVLPQSLIIPVLRGIVGVEFSNKEAISSVILSI